MRISVDYDKCSGHGMCEGIAEDVFEVTADGVVRILMDPMPEDRRKEMEEAVEMCPTGALSIKDW
jgi:ferredoxin